MSKLQKLRSLKNYKHFNKTSAGLGIVIFAAIGTILLFATKAATPFASIEPEQGTITSPAASVSGDATASGGSAIRFTAASSACSYPAQVLDLTNWKETLPTGSAGSPTEIKQPQLATYSADPYFMPTSTCNGVVFRAPTNGVTTSGSSYPRSELREMTSNGTANASWSTNSGTHTMTIDQAIMAVPKGKKHVVAGQIHDASDDVIVVRLEFPKLFIDHNGVTGPTLTSNYVLGTRFKIQMVASGGSIKTYYNDVLMDTYVKTASGSYFKAGAYTQSNCTTETQYGQTCASDNYGQVDIYNVTVQHQ